jgi:hypothetical protein
MYVWLRAPARRRVLLAGAPLSWIFESPTTDWRRALSTRTYYFLYKWTWYEWLGAIGPLVLFWVLWRWADRIERHPSVPEKLDDDAAASARPKSKLFGETPVRPAEMTGLARFCFAVLLYGVFQQALAMILLAPASLVRVTPLQPMRYLHLVYLFLVLIGGGLLGRHILKDRVWVWSVFLVAAFGGMFLSQRALFPASQHLELPERPPANQWLQAFAWIRQNTPKDAYFALDPNYLAAPGEDYHSFRALAERSQLADAIKDAAVVTQAPELGSRWTREVDAQAGWNTFKSADFERLKARFGVDWVLVSNPPPNRLTCIWRSERIWVCRIACLGAAPTP